MNYSITAVATNTTLHSYIQEEQILNYKKELAVQCDMAVAIPGTFT
jgi:hypothetical protein